MKAEIGYPDVVMGDFIQDLIGDIEHNMRLAPPNDQYFEELSIQKFALQQLLQEIGRHEGDSPTAVVARFVERMSATAKEDDPRFVFSISRDAASPSWTDYILTKWKRRNNDWRSLHSLWCGCL